MGEEAPDTYSTREGVAQVDGRFLCSNWRCQCRTASAGIWMSWCLAVLANFVLVSQTLPQPGDLTEITLLVNDICITRVTLCLAWVHSSRGTLAKGVVEVCPNPLMPKDFGVGNGLYSLPTHLMDW